MSSWTLEGALQDIHKLKDTEILHRMALAFYCLSTLDLLGAIEFAAKEDERGGWKDWIWEQYVCKHTHLN